MPIYQIGIDLGTTLVRVYRPRRGILFTEPTCVAFDTRKAKEDGGVIAYGEEAARMVGREPDFIRVVYPLSGGVVADYTNAERILRRVLTRVCGGMLVKPAVALCMPAGVTDVERAALENAALEAGARRFLLIEEPVAAALGVGVDVGKPLGSLIVDIGGGSTDCAVMSMHNVIVRSSCRTAGNALNEAIARWFRYKRGLLVGIQTAEALKITRANVFKPSKKPNIPVKGRLVNGPPATLYVSEADLYEAMKETLAAIAACIGEALERCPPELAGDIIDKRMFVTGGGALLRGLGPYLARELGVPATIPDNPQDCVAIGTGLAFRYAKAVRRAERVRLRMLPRSHGVPEAKLRRADERSPDEPRRPEWFTRADERHPAFTSVPLPDDPFVPPAAPVPPEAEVPSAPPEAAAPPKRKKPPKRGEDTLLP